MSTHLLQAELSDTAAAGQIRPVDRHDAVVVFSLILAHVHGAILFAPEESTSTSADRLWAFCLSGLSPQGRR